MSKVCTKCNIEKTIDEYSKSGKKKNGGNYYHSECKACSNQYRNQRYQDNKEEECAKRRQHYQDNKEELCAKSIQRYHDNKENAVVIISNFCCIRKSESLILL